MKKTKTILSYGGVLILGIMLGQCSGVEPTESPQVAASEPAAPSQAAAPISRLPAQPVAIPPQPAARAGRAIPSEDYVKTFPSRAELRQEIEHRVREHRLGRQLPFRAAAQYGQEKHRR